MSKIEIRAEKFLDNDPYVRSHGIKLISIDDRAATLEVIIQEHQRNFLGSVHGGCLFTLADTAFGLTANCAGLDNVSVGIDTHMAFVRGCKVGDRIRANAWEVSRSKRTAVFRVDLSCEGDLIAIFTGTVYVTERILEEPVYAP